MVTGRAFIFHMCISCGNETFSLVSTSSVKIIIYIKITVFTKWPLQGHSCFTNTSCCLVELDIVWIPVSFLRVKVTQILISKRILFYPVRSCNTCTFDPELD